MLVTKKQDHDNQLLAMCFAGLVVVIVLLISFFFPPALILLLGAAPVFWLTRRSSNRRRDVMRQPFPDEWERTLITDVEFFRALDDEGKERFRNMVKVFLDEITITGIRTDVDEQTRALVAASAVIPVFGFDDWEYSRLGEVLIYPNAFGDNYGTEDSEGGSTLGMVGVNHLSGVMILSKPDLISGFTISNDKRNVGIHEFAHLVDKADGTVDGLPAGIPAATVRPWIDWVAKELVSDKDRKSHIDDYAYTNEAEYFAVLTEYFFEAPDTLQRKNPQLYAMMQAMYRQDTGSFLSGKFARRKRVGRNADCPCGSKKKFKICCGTRRKRGNPAKD